MAVELVGYEGQIYRIHQAIMDTREEIQELWDDAPADTCIEQEDIYGRFFDRVVEIVSQ